MRGLLATLFALVATACFAQGGAPVKQSGNVTPGHIACWTTNGIVQDCGNASNGFATALGVTGQGNQICQNSGPLTGPYNQICLGATPTGGTLFFKNNGGATGQMTAIVNGVSYVFPFTPPATAVQGPNSSTVGDPACWNNTAGTLLSDCGTSFVLPNNTNISWKDTGATTRAVLGMDNTNTVLLNNPATSGALNIEANGFIQILPVGELFLGANSAYVIALNNGASVDSIFEMQGAILGNSPLLSSTGSASNVGMRISTKGTGVLSFEQNNFTVTAAQIGSDASLRATVLGYTDLRLWASLSCNPGTPSSTNVDSAITAAHAAGWNRFFIPSGCFWDISGQVTPTIPDGYSFLGENNLTSGISAGISKTILFGGHNYLDNIFYVSSVCYNLDSGTYGNPAMCPLGHIEQPGAGQSYPVGGYPFEAWQIAGPSGAPNATPIPAFGGHAALSGFPDLPSVAINNNSNGDALFIQSATPSTGPAAGLSNGISMFSAATGLIGNGIFINYGAAGGSFSGDFVQFQNNSVAKFTVDSAGNIFSAGTATIRTGIVGGTPTGGDKGAGTINIQTGYYANGTLGVSTTCTITASNTYVFTMGLLTSKGANCT